MEKRGKVRNAGFVIDSDSAEGRRNMKTYRQRKKEYIFGLLSEVEERHIYCTIVLYKYYTQVRKYF